MKQAWSLVLAAARDAESFSRASHWPADDPERSLIDLYLPICAATTLRPVSARPMFFQVLPASVDL